MTRANPSVSSRNPRLYRGYTTVELLIALGVFAIGITGIASMQKVTASSNAHAKNLAQATYLAQSWQDNLAIDASSWTKTTQITNTRWLNTLLSAGGWNLPAALPATTPTFGPAFSAGGRFVDHTTTSGASQVVFCTHIRITKLFNDAANELLRSEVRVFWPKEGRLWNSGAAYCASTADITDIEKSTDLFHFVYQATTIRQTPGFGQ